RITALFVCVIMCISCTFTAFVSYAVSSSSQIKAQIDSIISYKQKSEGAKTVQSLVSDVLSKQVGVGAEWYILSLVLYNPSLDYSEYRSALEKYVSSGAGNPTEREMYALLLAATGYSGNYIGDIIESSTGKLGIMSYIYSLHLLNLGYKAQTVTKQAVITELLSRQKSDGGFAVSGNYGDVDTTAMTLQALSQNVSDSKVNAAINKALSFLSSRLDENGEYSSYGAVNSESTSQVIIALSALGIDLEKDSRFIKNGKTLIDTLLSYKMSDGSFSHIHEKGSDSYATVQALSAFVAYYRFLTGKGSLYKFSVKIPSEPVTTQPATTQKTTSTATTNRETTKAPSTTKEPSTTKSQSTGLLGGLDILGIFSQTTENHTVTSQTAAQTKETTSTALSTSDTAASQTASTVSETYSSKTSAQTESVSSQKETEETVTEPSSETSSAVQGAYTGAETQTAQSDEAEKGESPSAAVYVIAVLVLVGAVSAVIIIKKRH
ncbi:MAG: hypothetical protein ACI4RU_06910, partial [Acutalibacteraceae bacterium]